MAFSCLVLKPEPGLALDHRAVTYKVKNVTAVPQLPHQSFERRTPTGGKLSASNAFHTCFRPRYLGRYVKRRQTTAAGPIGSTSVGLAITTSPRSSAFGRRRT